MKPKRLISLLVAVCMMITMLPLSAVTAFAADTATEQEAIVDGYKYKYKVNGGNATITDFCGPVKPTNYDYDIDIPETLDGKYTVTAIGERAFRRCSSLTKVTIPDSVTSIGDYAFNSCLNLTSVTIKDAATSIGEEAFGGCTSLTTLKLGEKIKTIGNFAFYSCSALTEVIIPQSVTSIGEAAFDRCGLHTLTIEGPIESMGLAAFYECTKLETISFGEKIKTIGKQAFQGCSSLTKVTIPDSVTSIGKEAFYKCTKLETISFGENIETIGRWAFTGCSALTNVTIPEKVTTIESDTFENCSKLEYIILPAGLTSFQDNLTGCPDNCVIYYNKDKVAAHDQFGYELAGHKLLGLCHVTFDANGGKLNGSAKVPVYETEKITDTKANDLKATDLDAINAPTRTGYKFTGWYTTADGKPEDGKFDVDKTEIMDDITLHAGWEFDPNALDCHPLTVTGGTVTVKYDGSDVTSKLNSRTDAATGKTTYDVPEGAEVTVTLDKNTVPNGKVFDGWSTSLPTGQDYKAESITFSMSNDMNVSAKYRDAATDHTPATAVCHPLTVTGGIVTVKKGDKDVTDTLTVTTDETTGKKTYSVPDGAEVTVTLDKTLIPEGMVFDIWSTGKFSLPLGQDYKAESITFPMSSDVVDIAAQYRDATIEDDGPNVLGTAAIIGTAAVGTAVLGYQAYSLGAEFAGKLMALPYFPSNRSALAMMLWEDAGKPMPESELLYPDVGQEERDMDLQHAARWAMENELIPDLNDEGTAPEEMKFFPANPVSKLDVLNAWQKAQELKNN